MTSSTAIRISAATSKFSSTSSATGRRAHLEIIASDVRSSWGQLPDFVICDELCHWAKPDLWYSLLSSAAKKPTCVLTVLTNAGIGRGWQWDIREAARTSPDWHFSSLQGSQAPWISDKDLAEQERLLPRPVFDRLWRNLWQHSDGEFVTLAEAEGCCDPSLTEQAAGRPGRQYFAALDYAEKIDRTVGVILHREGERLIVDRMDVVDPAPERPTPVRWVRDWMERIAATFWQVRFVLDEYQLLGVLQDLEGRFDVARFDFSGGKGNHALALQLRNLIVHRHVVWYPGCGAGGLSPRRPRNRTGQSAPHHNRRRPSPDQSPERGPLPRRPRLRPRRRLSRGLAAFSDGRLARDYASRRRWRPAVALRVGQAPACRIAPSMPHFGTREPALRNPPTTNHKEQITNLNYEFRATKCL